LDNISDAEVVGPPPAWQLEELECRDAEDHVNPEPTCSWGEAQQSVKKRLDLSFARSSIRKRLRDDRV